MPRAIFVRTLTSEEKEELLRRARSRTEAARRRAGTDDLAFA